MPTKLLLLLLLVAVLVTLGVALYHLVRDGAQRERAARALTWRTLLSIALFLLLLAAFAAGWITPHAPPFAIPPHHQ